MKLCCPSSFICYAYSEITLQYWANDRTHHVIGKTCDTIFCVWLMVIDQIIKNIIRECYSSQFLKIVYFSYIF
jgi:hypothetical protein